MACYIYEHPEHRDPDIYKIGKSNNVIVRYMNLSTSYENEITNSWYLYPKRGNDYSSGMLFFIEKTIHRLFDSCRRVKSSEFFQIRDINSFLKDLVEYFEQINTPLVLTRNVEDLKDLYDYAVPAETLTEEVTNRYIKDTPRVPKKYLRDTATSKNPYKHQEPILEAIYKWHESDETAGKIILPPGIGKSYITSFYLRSLSQESCVPIFVPLRSIKVDFDNALQKCEVVCNTRVIVNDTARKTNWHDEDAIDVIIYDEAHHMCATENKKLLNIDSEKKLFLTATEKVINDNDAFDMNDPVFGKCIYRMSILEAIQKGLLADYKVFLTDWTKGLRHTVETLQEMHRRKIIMFFNKTANAIKICDELNGLGFSAKYIIGTTSMTERANIIQQFETMEFSIICNVGCMGEGVNIPCIDTVIFMEKRESNIGIIQNIGRGLRKHPSKDFCMVVIKEEMMNYRFIKNLLVYDSRWSNARAMLLGKEHKSAKNNKTISYSIDGIIKMIELGNTKGLNATEAFIQRLRSRKIYSASEYHKAVTEYTDEYPKYPIAVFDDFNYADLLKCKNPYNYDECIARILELYETEKDNLKKIRITANKFTHICNLDNRIDIGILEKLKIDKTLSKKLNLLFNSVAGRRIIK